jgi:hypothetical protein
MLKEFIEAQQFPGLHAVMRGDGPEARALAVHFFPQIVVADADGRIVTVVVGAQKPARRHVRMLLRSLQNGLAEEIP